MEGLKAKLATTFEATFTVKVVTNIKVIITIIQQLQSPMVAIIIIIKANISMAHLCKK